MRKKRDCECVFDGRMKDAERRWRRRMKRMDRRNVRSLEERMRMERQRVI